ncbi:hypothetical protein SAMN05421823_102542 [Catalinimonas alkaloidigena]|uniref:Uncharacterized protein n=1 Tax=Catalinimonas alkaloidigena TaxID=1075417 RepID=A0A1G9B7Y5_9BACT|nr:hypothetical protein [Catalinimonas alkaloidigena]SDK35641.1 hypothetical protein SAMN05421823_102542 [Catalinimonas alkaloidigena]
MLLKVPVRSHLKKYLQSSYRDGQEIGKGDELHTYLTSLLKKPPLDYRPKPVPGEFIAFRLSSYLVQRNITFLSDQAALKFNIRLEALVRDQFHRTMDDWIYTQGFNFTEAFFRWMGLYDWTEEEIQMEALKKSYYRYRRNAEKIAENKIEGTPLVLFLSLAS